ncbi:MAG: NAD(+) kinase [Chromatiaceae bacterium]|nr:MAG: NAD(+) kinase [Chromatiaceae bacterium]
MTSFHTVGIIGKQRDEPQFGAVLQRLMAHLHRRDVAVLVDACSASQARAAGLDCDQPWALAALGQTCDLIIVVGGDGTLLQAARDLANHAVPLVGINLGRLGFLVDISPCHIEDRLDQILRGEYESDRRALIETRMDGGAEIGCALNDVVLHKWNSMRMIEFETYIDGCFVNAQRSDGLIVATPTGSTAYALSGGGPLIHPGLDALLLVPICPHTLSNRPLVVPGASCIEIRICQFEPEHVRLTCDGQFDLPLAADTPIRITRGDQQVTLLHPPGHDHYGILRAKLGWSGHPQSGQPC